MRAPKFILIYKITKLKKELKEASEAHTICLSWIENTARRMGNLRAEIINLDREIRNRNDP